MNRVGIIGAGTIGTGAAANFAQKGFEITLLDVSDGIIQKAKDQIYNDLRFQIFFHKDKDRGQPEEVINRITFSTDYQLLADKDFIIENVNEKWAVKKEVYEKIDGICPDHCIFLVNTSCISITRLAGLTNRPAQIIGAHFMNPVPVKTAVEVIRGYHTSEQTVASVKKLLAEIGKECIVVNDYPGFVSNRLSHLLMNEAAYVVQDQVAGPQEVDEIFKQCFGHKMGPLETADLIGLDTVVDSLEVLYESYQDPKFRCCPLLKKMVYAGLLGRKSGQGFYNYQEF